MATLTETSSSSSSSSTTSSSSSDEEEEEEGGLVEVQQSDEGSGSKIAEQVRRYRTKSNLLKERFVALSQDNEQLVSRIYQVRALCREGFILRKFLMERLDFYGDNFRNIPMLVPNETALDQQTIKKKLAKVKQSALSSAASSKRRQNPRARPHRPPPPVLSSTPIPPKAKGRKRPRSTSSKEGVKKKTKRQSHSNAGSSDGSNAEQSSSKCCGIKSSNASWKPQDAFLYFCQEHRASVQKSLFQGCSQSAADKKQVAEALAELWDGLPEDQRQRYFDVQEDIQKHPLDALRNFKGEKRLVG